MIYSLDITKELAKDFFGITLNQEFTLKYSSLKEFTKENVVQQIKKSELSFNSIKIVGNHIRNRSIKLQPDGYPCGLWL